MLSMLGLHTRSIENNNMVVGMLMALCSVCRFISGIMESINGNNVDRIILLELLLVVIMSTYYLFNDCTLTPQCYRLAERSISIFS
jgi:succinate-acetate transporter protein